MGTPREATAPPEASPTISLPTRPTPTRNVTSGPQDVKSCNVRLITNRIATSKLPSPSPDGTQFAIGCESRSLHSVCLLNEETGEVSQLAYQGPVPSESSWSPDGRTIAFLKAYYPDVSNPHDYEYELTIMAPAVDAAQNRITYNPSGMGHSLGDLVWSPDSARIAFTASSGVGEPAKQDIYIVNADGTGLQRLTYPPAAHYAPQWSPDGAYLAYVSAGRTIDYVTIIDLRTSGNPTRQLQLQALGGASWSPVSRQLLYESHRTDNVDIYIYDIGVDQETRVTDAVDVDFAPRWSPDGDRILFLSNRTGSLEVYSIGPTGEDDVQHTSTTGANRIVDAFWSVDGNTIYFLTREPENNEYGLYAIDAFDHCGP